MTLPGDLPPEWEASFPPRQSQPRDAEAEPPDAELEPAVAEPELVACWRCGMAFSEDLFACPVCRAKNREYKPSGRYLGNPLDAVAPTESSNARRRAAGAQQDPDFRSLQGVFKVFLVLLGTSIIQGAVLYGMKESNLRQDELHSGAQTLMVVIEVIDTLVVLMALYFIGRPPRYAARSGSARWVGGLGGVLLVGVAFGLNVLYHHLLQLYIFPNGVPDELLGGEESLLFGAMTTLAQPAIIEELFFRYLVLDNLRAVTTTRAAIWISSIAFGMAHLGNPIAIPVLIVVGASLGYLRVWSGTLWAPMIMHAVHNGVALFLDA